jgi:hypothetical protein
MAEKYFKFHWKNVNEKNETLSRGNGNYHQIDGPYNPSNFYQHIIKKYSLPEDALIIVTEVSHITREEFEQSELNQAQN